MENVIVYTCSGASNTGQTANEVAKKLANSGVGKMSCAIALGANFDNFINNAKKADMNIIIDGCPITCVKKVFENNQINNVKSFKTTDLGVNKNQNFNVESKDVERISEYIRNGLLNKY